MKVAVTVLTHRGSVRETNEDRILVGPWLMSAHGTRALSVTLDESPAVVAVLDGMGGHAGGEVAAAVGADVIGAFAGGTQEAEVVALVREANDAVYRSMVTSDLLGMGATVAGMVVNEEDAILFNVGDARIYVEADGYFVQASVDDSLPGRTGSVTQSLGGLSERADIEPHVSRESTAGRRFLIASDGLYGHVGPDELTVAMRAESDLVSAQQLLQLALERGGPDNISLAIVRREETA